MLRFLLDETHRADCAASLRSKPPLGTLVQALLLLVMLLFATACTQEKPPPTPGAATKQLNALRDALSRTLIAQADSHPQACDEAWMRKRLGDASAKVLVVPREQMENWVRGQATPAGGKTAFLRNRLLEDVTVDVTSEEQAIVELSQFQTLKDKRPFLVLLDFSEFLLPSVQGESYRGGRVQGMVALFELGDATLLCSSVFSAASSAELTKRTSETLAATVEDDFVRQVRSATGDAISALSRHLSP